MGMMDQIREISARGTVSPRRGSPLALSSAVVLGDLGEPPPPDGAGIDSSQITLKS